MKVKKCRSLIIEAKIKRDYGSKKQNTITCINDLRDAVIEE